jgi:predicted enzyme related to lactoylglutathione lyase
MRLLATGAVYLLLAGIAHPVFAQSATPQDPHAPRIAFVKIDVNDLDKSAAAYCSALQMQDIGRISSKQAGLDEATLKFGDDVAGAKAADHTGIVLVAKPGRKSLHGAPGRTPAAVLTVPDVAATVERGRTAGFTIVEPVKNTGAYSVAMIADTSGNVIELIHLPQSK